jgi:excisionase family DNA binding protein
MAIQAPDRLMYGVNEAARLLSIPRTKVYAEIASGGLVSVKVGRTRLIPAEALAAFVARLIAEQDCRSAA